MKFSELKKQLRGKFWTDFLTLDQRLIEQRFCPGCRIFFTYYGVSNAAEYRAYGVCESCDFAKHFWTEAQERFAAKKRLSKAGV